MKPAPFDYAKPATIAEALDLLDIHGDDATVLAGGQSLVATLNLRLSAPAIVIDINGIDDLKGISESGGVLRIGALARHAEVAASDLVARHAPLIAQAMPHVAHPAVRNRGTFGGSVAFADPAAEIPACVLALDASIEITGAAGTRQVAAADFFRGLYDTELGLKELITAVDVPVIRPGYVSGFDELARRHGDYAMIGLAAQAKIDGTALTDIRLVFLSAGGTPMRAPSAEAELDGKPVDDGCLSRARDALDGDLDPFDDPGSSAAMKMHLARELLGRVVKKLVENGTGEGK